MKERTLLLLLSFLCVQLHSQVLIYTEPAFPTTDDDITVYFNTASCQTENKEAFSNVYAYTGVITDECNTDQEWKYIVNDWKGSKSKRKMEAQGDHLYTLAFNIRDFYHLPMAENVLLLAFEFRDTNNNLITSSKMGSDFYIPIYQSNIPITTRLLNPTTNLQPLTGEAIEISGIASKEAELAFYDNGQIIASSCGTNLTHTIIAESGYHFIALVATDEDASEHLSYFSYHVEKNIDTDLSAHQTEFENSITSSINENLILSSPESEVSYNITPNPSDGDLSVYYQTNSNTPIELNIIDVKGKPVYNEFITSFPGIHSKSLEMDLEAGIYLVQLKMEDKINTQKLIIQK